MSHTPGPWEAMPMPQGSSGMRIFAGNQYLAFVGDTDHISPSEANAALIAAAPDMLDALEYWMDVGDDHKAIDKARAAIAKARGGQ